MNVNLFRRLEKLKVDNRQCGQEAVNLTDRSFTNQEAYQQALSDFCIEDLLEEISNYCDADFEAGRMNLEVSEIETLTVLIIQQLSKSINGKLLSGYLNALRHGNSELLPTSINEEIQSPDAGLPNNFPDVEIPQYVPGKIVRWKSALENPDWGIVLGYFYAFASHRCRWGWKYVVLLDKTSPSSAWCVADTAWEEDLEEMNCEK